MVSPPLSADAGYLLAHEMIHSWNGKYRCPAGLATVNYHEAMIGDLLWVYEGLTGYLGEVLDTRSLPSSGPKVGPYTLERTW